MIVRDNHGRIIGQFEHFRDNNGNTFDTNTMYDSRERLGVQEISIRDNQGHVENWTIPNGKLLPWSVAGGGKSALAAVSLSVAIDWAPGGTSLCSKSLTDIAISRTRG